MKSFVLGSNTNKNKRGQGSNSNNFSYLISLGFKCAATSPDDANPWLKVDLGRPINIVSVNFTLASDTHDAAAVVPNIEVRMGNGSGARENALCEWVGRIQLVSRRQRNFVFESCNGVGRDRLSDFCAFRTQASRL